MNFTGLASGTGRHILTVGYVSIHLHAHLPFVRHPEHERFLEEEWLYEAMTETYLPLYEAFSRLRDEGARFRVSMTMTPPLCEMLADDLLRCRYFRHLENLVELSEKEAKLKAGTPFQDAALMYAERFRRCRELFSEKLAGDVVGGYRRLQDDGVIEIVTCPATHGYLPLFDTDEAVRAQVMIGAANYRKHFGRQPNGVWLSECAYRPGLERFVLEAGIRYFCLDGHGILHGSPRPKYGIFAPVYLPNGVAAFARDDESSKQVWSRHMGYPGDYRYREFYRDLGYDADYEYILPYLHDDGVRRNIGIKYHRITGDVGLDGKEAYVPGWAHAAASEHAADFLRNRCSQIRHLAGLMDRRPLVFAPYDAELYGHWWYEGPVFLEELFRKSAAQDDVRFITLSDYLDEYKVNQIQRPAASSWGDKGYSEVWLAGTNDWIYRHLHKAEARMRELADRFVAPSEIERRALAQAGRELLLAQSSDWAFIMTTGTMVEYARKRTNDHVHRFTRLYEMLVHGSINAAWLAEVGAHDNIFSELDYTVWRTQPSERGSACE